MKILFIHNDYAKPSGEEHAAEGLASLLTQNGHIVEWYRRSSAEIGDSSKRKIQAFFSGFYSATAMQQVKEKIKKFNPDVVQVQNLYPLISPAVLKIIKKEGIPIVMRCPNYRIFCPNGLFLDNTGEVCEKCTGSLKETWCILKNCEKSLPKSIGYSLRNMSARLSSAFFNNVNVFIVQSGFQKKKFNQMGIPIEKLHIIPGLTPPLMANSNNILGNKVTFVGRVSPEKGIYEFIEAAKQLPDIPFVIAGRVDKKCTHLINSTPANIEWKGFISGVDLDELYIKSRIIVIPSKWYEGFPNVITRAMIHGKPVITSDIGVMSSIIDHNKNGLLTEPGNIPQLKSNIETLYYDELKCNEMGKNGREKAELEYATPIIYNKLIQCYNKAIKNINV